MSVAGTLAVNVVARTSKFGGPIRGARRDLRGFVGEAKSASRTVAGFLSTLGLGIGGGGIVAGLGAITKSTLTYGDSLSKASQRLNIGTQDLAAYRFALDSTAGLASGTVDLALQRMTRRIGQAAMGTGEAKKFLDSWNISAKEFAALNAGEQFRIVTGHIAELGTQSERLAAAMGFFDTEGAGIATNIGAIAGEAQRFREMGGFAPTEEEARRLEAYNQKLSDTLTILKGMTSRKVVESLGMFTTSQSSEYAKFAARNRQNEINATGMGGISKLARMVVSAIFDAPLAYADAYGRQAGRSTVRLIPGGARGQALAEAERQARAFGAPGVASPMNATNVRTVESIQQERMIDIMESIDENTAGLSKPMEFNFVPTEMFRQ